ncbi:hypothetical protein BDSB_27215 [Burkholderia dolosa PC543]|nr:hypothetical protein BDSB_27215 [Burkholderia dolosa PC543]
MSLHRAVQVTDHVRCYPARTACSRAAAKRRGVRFGYARRSD